jgi:hypothetical protein
MRFPLSLLPRVWVVLDGPDPHGTSVELARWRDGQTRSDGPPMFAPAPLLTAVGPIPAAHFADVVLPALDAGCPVTVDGGVLQQVAYRDGATCADLERALDEVYDGRRPDLLAVWPQQDGGHPRALYELARNRDEVVLLRPGGVAMLALQLFDAMARRGLYTWGGR